MENDRAASFSQVLCKDSTVTRELALKMQTGDLEAFQILRKAFNGDNRDNKCIKDVPEGTRNLNLAHMATIYVVFNLFHSFDKVLEKSDHRIPVSSLVTLKSFASSLGNYMSESLVNGTNDKTQRDLAEVAKSFFQLKKELETFGSSPKAWISL